MGRGEEKREITLLFPPRKEKRGLFILFAPREGRQHQREGEKRSLFLHLFIPQRKKCER